MLLEKQKREFLLFELQFFSSKNQKDWMNMPQESVTEGKKERLAVSPALYFAVAHKISLDKMHLC